jgi:tetratricopeptide (TPR) repeat protein
VALQHLEQAIEATPLDTDLYEDCATVLARQGRLEEALQYLDRAIRIREDDSDLHYRRGRVLGALNRFDAALQAYERSLELDDLNQQTLDALAALLVRGGNREAAAGLYRSAIERAQKAGRRELEQKLRGRVEALERQAH